MDSHLIESSVEMITSNKTSCLLGRMPGIWPRHSQHRDVGRGDSHATPSRRRRRFIDAVPAPGMSWQPTGQVDDRPFQRIQFHKPPPPPPPPTSSHALLQTHITHPPKVDFRKPALGVFLWNLSMRTPRPREARIGSSGFIYPSVWHWSSNKQKRSALRGLFPI